MAISLAMSQELNNQFKVSLKLSSDSNHDFIHEQVVRKKMSVEEDYAPSSVSTNGTEIRSTLEDKEESVEEPFLADTFLAQFHSCSESSSTEGEEVFQDCLDEEELFTVNSDDDESYNENIVTDSLSIQEKYLMNLGIHPEQQLDQLRQLFPYTFQAHDAHEHSRRRKRSFVELQLTSANALSRQNEPSFLGFFFRKMISWNHTTKQEASLSPSLRSTTQECVENNRQEEQSPMDSPQEIPGQYNKDDMPELGLKRGCVIRMEYYDKDLRKRAQHSMLSGRKNIAFLDKVEVMKVQNRKLLPREIRSKMFYTKTQFQKMVANNMKEIEIEVRKRYRKKAKRRTASSLTS